MIIKLEYINIKFLLALISLISSIAYAGNCSSSNIKRISAKEKLEIYRNDIGIKKNIYDLAIKMEKVLNSDLFYLPIVQENIKNSKYKILTIWRHYNKIIKLKEFRELFDNNEFANVIILSQLREYCDRNDRILNLINSLEEIRIKSTFKKFEKNLSNDRMDVIYEDEEYY